jgi:transcriptional regulator with XRE-family HTH domain
MPERPPNRIAELRERYGFSVRDLAEKLGWDHNKLHRLETGASRLDVETMRIVAAKLGLKPSVLLNDADVELRADQDGQEILALLQAVPRERWLDFLVVARQLLDLVHVMAAQKTAGALAGESRQIGELREAWNSFDDSGRDRVLAMLKLVQT